MNEKFIFTYPSFKMIGLSNEVIDGLARWYSFFAKRRSPTCLSEDMFLSGSAVVDEKSRKMGMRIFTSVIATQEKMEDVVPIEFLETFFDRLYFRC